jgi:hypothetical protein
MDELNPDFLEFIRLLEEEQVDWAGQELSSISPKSFAMNNLKNIGGCR